MDPNAMRIEETYRTTISAVHYCNPITELEVITGENGSSISGWKLYPR